MSGQVVLYVSWPGPGSANRQRFVCAADSTYPENVTSMACMPDANTVLLEYFDLRDISNTTHGLATPQWAGQVGNYPAI